MKAQRRHELKANSLIWHLQGLPYTIKKYQSQIALVLIVIAFIIVMVRYRMQAAQQRLKQAEQALSVAGEQLLRLRNSAYMPGMDPASYMKGREEFYFEGLQQAQDAYDNTPDSEPALKAQALLDRGDLNFQMANAPAIPGAATQPSLRPSEPIDTLLSNAYDAYMQVLTTEADQIFAVTAAHFGLAAVAEDRALMNKDHSQWDAAKTQYQAVIDSDAPPAYKDLAKMRLDMLPKLSVPITVGFEPRPEPRAAQILGPTTRK